MYYGALEAGGTKMVLSIVDEQGCIVQRRSIPTRDPAETMPEMVCFFRNEDIVALGIGCFGPLDSDENSPTYGSITTTPKLAWANYPIRKAFVDALSIPVAIDTDVNAAAIAEASMGAAIGKESCLYVTIGTGIGGGWVVHGKPVHGLVHPEVGHMLLKPEENDPSPDGFCPYHKHCLEGLAAGPAIEKRWGRPGNELSIAHPAWDLESTYLAQLCHNAMMMLSPQMIILGGGVMQQPALLDAVREKTAQYLGGYVDSTVIKDGLKHYIVAPGLGSNSGVLGAYLLAKQAEQIKVRNPGDDVTKEV